MFEVDAVDLMNITQVIVGHKDNEVGRGWFLHKVCVRIANVDSESTCWRFPCDRYADYSIDKLHLRDFFTSCISVKSTFERGFYNIGTICFICVHMYITHIVF